MIDWDVWAGSAAVQCFHGDAAFDEGHLDLIVAVETNVEGGAVGGNLSVTGFDHEGARLILGNLEPGLAGEQLDTAYLAVECHPNTTVGVEHDGRSVGQNDVRTLADLRGKLAGVRIGTPRAIPQQDSDGQSYY